MILSMVPDNRPDNGDPVTTLDTGDEIGRLVDTSVPWS